MYSEEEKASIMATRIRNNWSVRRMATEPGFPNRKTITKWMKEIEDGSLVIPEGCESWIPAKGRSKHSTYSQATVNESIEMVNKGFSLTLTAEKLGIASVAAMYTWLDKKPTMRSILMRTNPPDVEGDAVTGDSYSKKVAALELENDVLRAVVEVLKVASPKLMNNQEKTKVVNSLRQTTNRPLSELITFLKISKSSYEYQCCALRKVDKYETLRQVIKERFKYHEARWGSERIWAELRKGYEDNKPIVVSEKVVRRIMKEEGLRVVYVRLKKHYSSYQGEISKHPGNLVNRNFHSDAPNKLWLTDITQFNLRGFKCYLSPIIDCFDGKVISHKISKHPDATLVNSMLDDAATTLCNGESPICHNDCGVHYHWPGWIKRCDCYNIIRSMSKKGCSPDNSACEGFFGRLKNEFFYHKKWSNISFEEFSSMLDSWIKYYNEGRIKKSLGWMSPNEYRRSLGLAA